MSAIRRLIARECLRLSLPVSKEANFGQRQNALKLMTMSLGDMISRSRHFLGPLSRLSAAPYSGTGGGIRELSSLPNLSDDEVKRIVEDISEKFREAMELLDDARGSIGTVYFSEDMTDAENAIQDVLVEYDTLMKQMNEEQKKNVVRTIGLKIEELKAQVQMLKDSLKE